MISVILFGENKKILENQTLKDIEIISVGAEDISARNKALKEVKGEFVTFVSAKDELEPDYLEYLIKGIAGSHLSICGYNIEEDGECLYETPETVPRMMSGEDMQCRLFYQYHYQGYLQNKMFRRQIIQSKHLLFDETLEENGDFLFLMQYLRYAK
ncbi:MAG: glycosyltransferase family 2 protein, partial [Lachnospiraceae bacterium]|nr:glycosyltransferase family 2 protein [Lachnospiraceae bacterium]